MTISCLSLWGPDKVASAAAPLLGKTGSRAKKRLPTHSLPTHPVGYHCCNPHLTACGGRGLLVPLGTAVASDYNDEESELELWALGPPRLPAETCVGAETSPRLRFHICKLGIRTVLLLRRVGRGAAHRGLNERRVTSGWGGLLSLALGTPGPSHPIPFLPWWCWWDAACLPSPALGFPALVCSPSPWETQDSGQADASQDCRFSGLPQTCTVPLATARATHAVLQTKSQLFLLRPHLPEVRRTVTNQSTLEETPHLPSPPWSLLSSPASLHPSPLLLLGELGTHWACVDSSALGAPLPPRTACDCVTEFV